MQALLLLGLIALIAASDPSEEFTGKWTVLSENGTPCIKLYAQIDISLSYIKDDDSVGEAETITVPVNSTIASSSCYEKVQIGYDFIDSQVLQLDFPDNEGWNVRLAFSEDPRLDIRKGDYALYQVTITANYSAMPDLFVNTPKGHIHTYDSVVSFTEPPLLADNEYTKVGDCIFCPDAQSYIINENPHRGPAASIRLSNLQMQAYMTTEDFGKKVTCVMDDNELDLVPVVCSCILAGLVLFTLFSYFIYRHRLPTDILNMTEQEFAEEEDDEHHHHHKEEHSHLNHHDNHGFHEEERKY